MIISIYLKSTGQIISNRNINSIAEISHIDTDKYGYIEGQYSIIYKIV